MESHSYVLHLMRAVGVFRCFFYLRVKVQANGRSGCCYGFGFIQSRALSTTILTGDRAKAKSTADTRMQHFLCE